MNSFHFARTHGPGCLWPARIGDAGKNGSNRPGMSANAMGGAWPVKKLCQLGPPAPPTNVKATKGLTRSPCPALAPGSDRVRREEGLLGETALVISDEVQQCEERSRGGNTAATAAHARFVRENFPSACAATLFANALQRPPVDSRSCRVPICRAGRMMR